MSPTKLHSAATPEWNNKDQTMQGSVSFKLIFERKERKLIINSLTEQFWNTRKLIPWTNASTFRRKALQNFPETGKTVPVVQHDKNTPDAMADETNSQLLVPSLLVSLFIPRRSVTCRLVLKVTDWLTEWLTITDLPLT